MADDFRAMREHSRDKRSANRASSTQRLQDAGVAFESKNFGAHLVVMERIDCWPGTGLWRDRLPPKKSGRGIRSLLNYLETIA